jgi:RHS repeat-associated protein
MLTGVVHAVLAVSLVVAGVPLAVVAPPAAAEAQTLLSPPAPPPPVNPAPYVREVTTPGPTLVPVGSIARDVVWSPQGSPYVIPAGGITITEQGSLTLLPGTIVKFTPGTAIALFVHGSLYALGTPSQRVVFTSLLDDTAGGDTNGDGSTTAPGRGDWYQIYVGGSAFLDYVDIRFGGRPPSSLGCLTGSLLSANDGKMVLSNSRVTESATSAVVTTGFEDSFSGVYGNEFDNSLCGGYSDVFGQQFYIGNTFGAGISGYAWYSNLPRQVVFRYNTAYRRVKVVASGPRVDVRFNRLLGGADAGSGALFQANWYGRDINTEELPACMTDAEMAAYVPQLTRASSTSSCPPGTYPPKYLHAVLPALSAAPPGVAEAVLDATSARYGPVSTSGGWLTYRATDLMVEDAGRTLTAARTYVSKHTADSDAGPGWSTSFSEALSAYQGGSALALSDGSTLPFAVDPAAGYVPGGGVDADFATGPTGTTITTANRTSYQFDPAGDLAGLLLGDSGHRVDVDRTGGEVARVTGVSGRYLDYGRADGRLVSVTDSQGRGVDLTYSGGRLASVSDVDGQPETYEYDGSGRLVKVTAPSGLVRLAAEYQADGKVAAITEAGQGRTTFAYDPAARRTTITRADGSQVAQQYDAYGRLIVEQVVGGSATHVLYDGFGRQVVRIEGVPSVAMDNYRPVGRAALIDAKGDVVARIDPAGRATLTTYNSSHQPLVTTYPDGGTVTRAYDGDGRLATVTNQIGKVWSYTYNGRGQVLTQRNPLNQTRTLAYEPDGDLESVTDATGAVTRFEYDALGRPVVRVDAAGHRWQTGYTSWGDVRTATTPGGATTTREYTVDRTVTATVDGTGARTGYEYDAGGRLAATVDPLGQRATTAYDATGRASRVTDVRGYAVDLGYSPGGFVVSSTAPNGTTTVLNDPAGRPIRVTDPLGQVTQTVYDPAGAVIRVDRPDGSTVSSTLDEAGRVIKETSALNGNTSYTYDLAGRRLKRTDPLGHAVLWGYDALDRVVSVTDELGRVTTQAYDDAARTVTATDGLGTVSVTAFDALGQVVSETDGSGRITRYEYTVDGLRGATMAPGGGQTGYEYDAAGRLTAVVDPLGRRTSAVLDALGRPTSTTDPAGHATGYTYEPGGLVASVTDRTGGVRQYSYDPRGLVSTATDPRGKVTTFEYDALGRQTSTVDPTGAAWHTAYDPANRPEVTWDATEASWVTTYDLDGNALTVKDPVGVTLLYKYNKRGERTEAKWGVSNLAPSRWTYTYDAVGNLVSVKRPRGGIEATAYDQRDRPVSITRPDGTQTTIGYDGAGRQTSIVNSGGTTTWTYDDAGRMATAVDPLGNTARYGYDAAGQPTTLTLPRGGVYEYTYDALGAISTETDPNDGVTRYDYDAEGRLVRTETPAGRIVESSYDPAGNLERSEAGGLVRAFGYDDAGRLASTMVGGLADTAFSYNNRGLLATSTDRHGTTQYGYDDARRPTTITPPAGTPTTYTYRPDVSSINYGPGLLATVRGSVNVDYKYNAEGQVIERRFVAPGASRIDTFAYDTTGRVTSRTEAASAATTYTYTPDGQVDTVTEPPTSNPKVTDYGYDAAGRLTSQRVTQGGTAVSESTYGWDADGNRSSLDATTYGYDLSGQLTSSSDGRTYTYDADGALTAVDSATQHTTYGYNGYGELATVQPDPATTVTYGRDGLGRMSARTVDGATQTYGYGGTSYAVTRTALAGGMPTELVRGYQGETLGQVSTGSTLRPGTNIHRDVTSWQNNATGAVVGQRRYDPFGTVVEATGTTAPANLGFQGDPTDPATGLVDMGFRAYDPGTGRFASPDNLAGAFGRPISLNRYAYGNADPVNHLDPDGHWPQWIKDIVGGVRDYLNWWSDSWQAGWNDTQPTAKEPTWVHDVNTWVDDHHDGIAEFAVSTVVFAGCEAALGIPTAGVGAVAGAAACGTLAGTLGGLTGQAIRCREHTTPHACDPTEFTRAAVTSGIGGGVGAGLGGIVGPRIASAIASTRLGTTVAGRTTIGALGAGTAAAVGEGTAGAAAGAAGYGLSCAPTCSWAGLAQTAWDSGRESALYGGLFGTLGGGFTSIRAPAPDLSPARAPVFALRLARRVWGPGRADGEKVLSGHGSWEPGNGVIRVPEGTTLVFYIRHGEKLYDSIGNYIETGGTSGRAPYYKKVYKPGQFVQNYDLSPGAGLTIMGNPKTVSVKTSLADLLQPNMGTVHWAACREILPRGFKYPWWVW